MHEPMLESHAREPCAPCVDGKRKEASPVDELEVLSTTAAVEDDTVSDGGDVGCSTGSKRARCDGGIARGAGVDWRELPPGVLLRMLELLRANAIEEAEVAREEAAAAAAATAVAAAAEAGREEAEGEPAAEGAAPPQEAPPPPPPVGPSSGNEVEDSQDPRGPGVNEVMIASRVCKAWRATALELLLGDTACSRPPRLATDKSRGGKPTNSEFSKRSTAAVVRTDDAIAGKDKDKEEDSEAVSKPPLATTPQRARGLSSGSQGGRVACGRHGSMRTARRIQINATLAWGEEEGSARAKRTSSADHSSGLQLGPQEGTTWGDDTLSDS